MTKSEAQAAQARCEAATKKVYARDEWHCAIWDDAAFLESVKSDLPAALDMLGRFELALNLLCSAVGHGSTCTMLKGPDCNCGAASQQANALHEARELLREWEAQ
jgi:hypothetical protein